MKSKNPLHKRILTGILWCAVIFTLVFSMLQYFGVSFNVSAGYTKTLPFQGRLTNPNGTNVTDGKYDMTFRIFPCSTCNSQMIWEEGHTGSNAVTVEDSVFSVLLGTIKSLDIDFNSGTYWLEIQVGSEILSPRRQIGGTGYSINTDNITGIPGSINDTNLDAFPSAERAVVDALNYLLGEINTHGLWTDTGTALRPRAGASGNVSIPSGTLTVSGATKLSSTLAVSGEITAPAINTINSVSINSSGTITAGTWNGTQISDSYVVALDGATQGDILYHNGTQWTQLSAGTSGDFLMTQGGGANPIWNAVGGGAIADGTVANSTLHWSGGAWAENTTILTTATSVYGSGALTVYSSGANDLSFAARGSAATAFNDAIDLELVDDLAGMSIIGALNSLAGGTSGMWLYDAGDYLYPNDSYSGNVTVDPGGVGYTMAIGTTPTAGYSLDIIGLDDNARGINIEMPDGYVGTIYGIYTTLLSNDATTNYGNYISVSGGTTTNIGVYSSASGANSINEAFHGEATLAADEVGAYGLYMETTSNPNGNQSQYGIYSTISGTVAAATPSTFSVSGINRIDGNNLRSSAYGVYGESTGTNINASSSNYGVYGVAAEANYNYGGRFRAAGNLDYNYGVYAEAAGADRNYGGNFAASGAHDFNYGVYASASGATTNWAGYFAGDVYTSGKYVSGATITIDGNANTIATTSSALGVTATGAASDLTLGARSGTITLNEAGATTLSGFTATSIIGALNELAAGSGAGLWLDMGTYIHPDSTYADNVAIDSGTLGVGVTPISTYGVYSYTTASLGRAVYGRATTSDTSSYGVYGYSTGTNLLGGRHYGVWGEAIGSGGVTKNYGIYGTASGGATNWAGYFASGNVYITNNLGIAISPSYPLDVTGAARISTNLGVNGVNPSSTYGVYAYTAATNGRAVYGYAAGTSVTQNYGVYGYANASSTNSYGLYGEAAGTGSANYGIYATASGANDNYAAVFNAGNVGIGDTTPDYKLDLYDHSTNQQYAVYVDFLSTFSGDPDMAAIYGNNTSVTAADEGAYGVMGSASGASSVGWNVGVYGWADDNDRETIGVWGVAKGGGGYTESWMGSTGGYFSVQSDATGNQYGIQSIINSSNNARRNVGVLAQISVGAETYTDFDTDLAQGVKSTVTIGGSQNYGANSSALEAGNFTVVLSEGYTLQNVYPQPAFTGSFHNTGTVRNASYIYGVEGIIGGSNAGVYQDSSTWLIGVMGAIKPSYWGGETPTYTGVNAIGVYAEAENSNPTGTNYGLYSRVRDAYSNYGAYIWIKAGGAGTDYLAYLNPDGGAIEYGLYVESGSTTASINSLGTYGDAVGATNRDLYVDNAGKIGYVVSALANKQNIYDMEDISWLYRLNPVNYEQKGYAGIKQYGLIAEEVAKVNNSLVSYDEQGRPVTVSYSTLITPLLKAIQEHKVKIDGMASTNDLNKLSSRVKDLENKTSSLESRLQALEVSGGDKGDPITAGTITGDLGITGNLAVGGDVDITGTLKAASLWSQNATWHLDSQGELFVQKVETQELAIAEGPNKSLGGVVLPTGLTEIFITNTSVTADSRIFLTIESDSELAAGVKIKEKRAGEGFVIATGDDLPVTADLEINWLIIN